MTIRKTKEEISAIYQLVSSQDETLYHVAHARKENSDEEYDGSKFREIADARVNEEVNRLKSIAAAFKAHSIPRSSN